MKFIFTKLMPILLSVLCYNIVAAQMMLNYALYNSQNIISEHSSINSIISNTDKINSLDTSSYLYMDATRTSSSSGIGSQNTLTVTYDVDFPSDDKSLYFVYDFSDGTSDEFYYNTRRFSTEKIYGGSRYRVLDSLNNVIPSDSLIISYLTTVNNKNIVKIVSKRKTIKKIQFEVESATSARYTRWLKIYSIFSVKGTYSIDDCGTPVAGEFDINLGGVPLAGPSLSGNLSTIFDGDNSTFVTDYIAGLVVIGSPTWHHYVQFLGLSSGTNTVKAKIGRTGQSVALSGIRYKFVFYNQGKAVDSTNNTNIQVLGLIGINDYKPFDVYGSSNVKWDMVDLVVSQPGITVTGAVLRIYEISRTIDAPSLKNSKAIEVEKGEHAIVEVVGKASEFLWYKAIKFIDSTTKEYGYTIDTSSIALLGSSSGSYYSNTLNSGTFDLGIMTSDSVFFVRSLRSTCEKDTSAPMRMTIKIVETPLSNNLITYFSAQKVDNSGLLEWRINDNNNIHNIEVEKSSDGITFNSLAEISINTDMYYKYYDHQLLNGYNYYRLKMNNINGGYSYSKVQIINSENRDVVFYPNPVSDIIHVEAMSGDQYFIYNNLGLLIKQGAFSNQLNTINVSDLANGTYYCKIQRVNFTIANNSFIKK